MDVRRNTISVTNDCVVKTGDPDLMHLEAIKTIEAEKIAQKTNLFRVPHILDFNWSEDGSLNIVTKTGTVSIWESSTGEDASNHPVYI